MTINSSSMYEVKLYNTKTKEGMITAIEFRKKGEAESFIKSWKSQGEPFDAELIEREYNVRKTPKRLERRVRYR